MIFNRDYELIIQYDDVTLTIRPPMRIVFDAYKSVSDGLNKCTLQVYNLREDTRLKLIKSKEDQRLIKFSLKVGYDGQLRDAFNGQVFRGESARDGTDFITKLESLDGSFAMINNVVSRTVKSKEKAISQVLEDSGVFKGVITQQSDLTRPKVIVGNVIKTLDSFLEDEQSWFIDDGKLNIVKDTDVIEDYIPVVSVETGLTATPVKEFQRIEFETLMNPSIRPARLVQLESTVNPGLNGKHRVYEINYKGDYDGDDWSMIVKCNMGTYETIN